MTGTGANTVAVGNSYSRVGMIVGGSVNMTFGAAADTVTLNRLDVGGLTTLRFGDGVSTAAIDDSAFAEMFTLVTGAGEDTFNLETTAGTDRKTTFAGGGSVIQGAGTDTANWGAADANGRVVLFKPFAIHRGAGDFFQSDFSGSVESPFGFDIVYGV